MSISQKLGTGSSFGQVRRERSTRGKAKAITEGEIPAYELVRLRLDEVSPTPLNPRRNFGTDEELTRFGEELRQAQLAACVAVTRGAYLALWPDHEEALGSALHVLINGERRFRSAVHVGLDALDFVIRDDLASSREQFIKHLLEENLNREDFDVIERARGVEQLVTVCAEENERGARARAAEQLGKDRSWVTNQLVLLTLPVEIQMMLSAGTMSERDGRALARHLKENPGLDAARLLERLQQMKEAAAQTKALEKQAVAAARQGLLSADNEPQKASPELDASASSLSADNKVSVPAQGQSSQKGTESTLSASPAGSGAPEAEASPAAAPSEVLLSADNNTKRDGDLSDADASAPEESAVAGNDGGADTAKYGQPRQLPYDDALFLAHHLHRKMKPTDFTQVARILMSIMREQHLDEYNALLHELTVQEQQPA
ncbi:putative plasmid partitioning protein (plasmid) [Streptomyces hygroscopicus subsp. jinggangensis 5008]|nr:putative plasmid partitioning protein [Streptomyces hygroscopicus subsp. jinggangensis 5008]AGF68416.1 putative plasmid partitioning protein [Streptomyces hygroscopicus subsp. jinggangensis TL01]